MTQAPDYRPRSSVAGNLFLALVAVGALVSYHLAAATVANGVGVGDVSRSWGALTEGRPVAGLGPDVSGPTLAVAFVVWFGIWIAVQVVVARVFFGWRHRKKSPESGLAGETEIVAALGERALRESARQTRPGLSDRIRAHIDLNELGLYLGKDDRSGRDLWLSFEDHMVVTATTGGGKSVYVMVPAALTAPGAVVVTSNEVSILDIIAKTRSRKGRVWVFDPLNRSSWPEPMVWNPVAGCEDGRVALSRGTAFVAGMKSGSDSTNGGFFRTNAETALRGLLHAAALSGGDMGTVLRWSAALDSQAAEAVQAIRGSSDPRAERLWAGELESVSTGADETVASTRQTLQQAVTALSLREVSKWVLPADGVAEFDAEKFVTSTDTLVLISDDSSSTNVGPLCTMLLQEVMDTIKRVAPLLPARRLDPPLRLVGDEFANIAPVDKAPELSSEVRKLGVQWVLAFQDEQQARSRWGDRGPTLFAQMSAELVLPGLKSTGSLKRYSELAGKVWIEQHTTNFSEGDVRGGSASMHERDVLRGDEVRTLEAGTGLLVYRNVSPLVMRLTPWFKSARAKQLQADQDASAAARHAHARAVRAGGEVG